MRRLLDTRTQQWWSLMPLPKQVFQAAATLLPQARRITVHLGDAPAKNGAPC